VRFTRERYQSGCLVREPRKAGPAVWIFRWRETRPEGRVNRKVIVGTLSQYPTKAAALKAVEALRVNVNTGTYTPLTVHQLVTHYTQIELSTKAFSTSQVYGVYLKTLLSQLAENSARHREKHSIIHPLASCAEGRLAIRKCCC
jgi:integrase